LFLKKRVFASLNLKKTSIGVPNIRYYWYKTVIYFQQNGKSLVTEQKDRRITFVRSFNPTRSSQFLIFFCKHVSKSFDTMPLNFPEKNSNFFANWPSPKTEFLGDLNRFYGDITLKNRSNSSSEHLKSETIQTNGLILLKNRFKSPIKFDFGWRSICKKIWTVCDTNLSSPSVRLELKSSTKCAFFYHFCPILADW